MYTVSQAHTNNGQTCLGSSEYTIESYFQHTERYDVSKSTIYFGQLQGEIVDQNFSPVVFFCAFHPVVLCFLLCLESRSLSAL
jgi:hypothetical protein